MAGGLRVLSGNVDPSMPTKGYPAASGTTLVGNHVDRLLIGWGYNGSGHAATGTRIMGSQGASPTIIQGHATGTVQTSAPGGTFPAAVRLAETDVGLGATSGGTTSGGTSTVAGSGSSGDRVLAGMHGKGNGATHAVSSRAEITRVLAAMSAVEMNAFLQQVDWRDY